LLIVIAGVIMRMPGADERTQARRIDVVDGE
jgi:formyltetrahydrofolate synthetase